MSGKGYTNGSTTWLRALRTGTGLVLLVSFLRDLPSLDALFGAEGLVSPTLLAAHPQQVGISITAISGHLGAYTPLSARHCLWLLALAYQASACLLALRYRPRLMAMILLPLHHAFFVATPAYSYGYDYLALSALLYCALPYRGSWGLPVLRLLQAHLCLVYFFGGLGKAMGPTWRNGEALWKAVQQPFATPLADLAPLGAYPMLWLLGGWCILLLETTYPVLVWLRHTRRAILYGVLAMHVGIALFMGLTSFSGLMIVLNLAAFHYPYLRIAEYQPSISPGIQAANQTPGQRKVRHRHERMYAQHASTPIGDIPSDKPP